MSWTSSLEIARSFATRRLRGRLLGEVWTAKVEPWRLLAADTGGDEAEYVIDSQGLDIMRFEESSRGYGRD
jgi:hypothetical protein